MMEPAEAQGLLGNGVSPRRHIDTNRTVMPGGTVKTTTTMVTQKSKDGTQLLVNPGKRHNRKIQRLM